MNDANARRDLSLTDIEARLRALNPGLPRLRVTPPTTPGAAVRVTIETTRAELATVGGKLNLNDPDLEGMRLNTTLRFLDQKPGERINVQLRRADSSDAKPSQTGE